jgi:glycosyltransferase involved in cell wall biosynthesis
MKIAFFISKMAAGGAERQASILCNHWIGNGHDVVLTTFSDVASHYELHQNIRQRVLPEGRLNSYGAIRTILVEERPDIAISFMDITNVKVLLASLGTGVPVIVSERNVLSALYHTNPFRRAALFIFLRRLLYPLAAALVVQTEDIARAARRGMYSQRVKVIPNVVALTCNPASVLRQDQNRILAIGRLSHQKAQDTLIEAFSRLAGRFPEWTLRIIGEGELRPDLTSLVSSLELGGRVELAPVKKDVLAEYQGASIFALPSRFEGFPNVLVEAMQAGCAVVVSDCPGAGTEIVSDGQDGLVFRTGDIQDLTERLAGLMSDPHKREALGEQARKSVKRYDSEIVLPMWDRLIEAVARPAT